MTDTVFVSVPPSSSSTVMSNESLPTKSASGVYVYSPVTGSMDAVPSAGSAEMLNVKSPMDVSTSSADAYLLAAASSGVVISSTVSSGRSFTGSIFTGNTTVVSLSPSLTVNVMLNSPNALSYGTMVILLSYDAVFVIVILLSATNACPSDEMETIS